jgi:arylsulfatase A-like enzyme
MNHRFVAAAALVFALAASFSVPVLGAGVQVQGVGTPTRPPNVLLILTDDLGYGEVGCYGQERIKTPNIDRLAEQGMRFTDFYAGSTVCAPSRSVLLTGLHTGHSTVRANAMTTMSEDDFTVAELLKGRGYATAVIGKWGMGNLKSSGAPARQGFDYFYGYVGHIDAHNLFPAHLWRGDEKVMLKNKVEKVGERGSKATERVEYAPDLFFQEAQAFIREHKDRPFFLYYSVPVPHANSGVRKEGMEVPSDEPYSNESWPQREKNKAAMITRMDGHVGQIVEQLKQLGLDDKTLIVFTSDNGPHKEGGADPSFHKASGPLRGIKRDLYEGGIRVPMIVRWPGKVKAGTTSSMPCAFWDFLPTVAEAAGAEAPKNLDGVSILPTLLGRPQQQQRAHEFLYWEFHERGFEQAVRAGDWKAVRHGPDQPLELYDLESDIGETTNVAAKHPDVVKKIEAYLTTARTEPAQPIGAKRAANREARRAAKK